MTQGADRDRTAFGVLMRDVGEDLAVVARHRPRDVSAEDRSTWRRLFESVTPMPGESLRGLVARACCANYLPNSFGLLQYLGLVHRNRVNVSEDQDIDPAELAYAMRVDESEVRARLYPPAGRGHVLLDGLDLNLKRVETSRRRFSPTVFREPVGEKQHFHRAAWELRDIPFCMEGWDMLQDTCWCERGGSVQRWSRTATRVDECDRCGDPLSLLAPFPVPEEMRPALRLLKAIVPTDPEVRSEAIDALPIGLRGADRSDVLKLALRLATAIDPDAALFSFEEPERRLSGLHAACATMQDWPDGLARLRLPASATPATRDWLRAAWNRLSGPRSATWRTSGPSRTTDGPRKPGPKTGDGPVGIRPATEIARLSRDVLLSVWEMGLVTKHERRHGHRLLPAFDRQELVELGEAWNKRREPDAIAYELGLPTYGIEQMATLGCIVPDAPALPGTGPHFSDASVSEFVKSLGLGNGPVDQPVNLRKVMRLIRGRLKPWGPAFALLIDGSVPFRLVEGRRLIDRIEVAREAVEDLIGLDFDRTRPPPFGYDDTMVQNDALEVLNAHGDMTHVLAGLPSSGVNPKRYAVEDVERRARELAVATAGED